MRDKIDRVKYNKIGGFLVRGQERPPKVEYVNFFEIEIPFNYFLLFFLLTLGIRIYFYVKKL